MKNKKTNNTLLIKNHEIKSKVILAPMAGITSFSYRKFMHEFNPNALTFTEMISDFGLIYDNEKTLNLLKSDGSDKPLAIQLFGGSKETIIKAINVINNLYIDFDFLDLNLACPMPKIIKNKAGSFWLKDQVKLYDLMKDVVLTSKKPVTAKVRIGYDEININETVKTLEKAGVSFISIHARTRDQLYYGKPNFEVLKDIKKIISIPFGISGDIYTVSDALNALNLTKADAILVARGGIGNPKLFKNIDLALNNLPYDETLNLSEQKEYLLRFSSLLIEELGEKRAISILRGIAPKFFLSFPNSKKYRSLLAQKMSSKEDLINILNDFN